MEKRRVVQEHGTTVEWKQVGEYEDIRFEVSPEGMAKITICRPEVRNAFRPQTNVELYDAFARARDDSQLGVVLFTGEGDQALLLRRRSAGEGRRRIHGWRRGGASQRSGSPALDPVHAHAGDCTCGGLRDWWRTRASPGLRSHPSAGQRAVWADGAQSGKPSMGALAPPTWRASSARRRREKSGTCVANTVPTMHYGWDWSTTWSP